MSIHFFSSNVSPFFKLTCLLFLTGSAHTVLADYWQKELGVSTFYGKFYFIQYKSFESTIPMETRFPIICGSSGAGGGGGLGGGYQVSI